MWLPVAEQNPPALFPAANRAWRELQAEQRQIKLQVEA
jgi:hypothetical protein